VKMLRSQGYVAMRAPASLGVFDVIAVKDGRIRLIEVKSTTRSAWSGFLPADRSALLDAAQTAGAEAELCWWPKHRKPTFLTPDEWP
jgi:Holliday junction resolvase